MLFFIKTPVGNFLINIVIEVFACVWVSEKMCRENERIIFYWWCKNVKLHGIFDTKSFYGGQRSVCWYLSSEICFQRYQMGMGKVTCNKFFRLFYFYFVLDTKIYFMPRYLLCFLCKGKLKLHGVVNIFLNYLEINFPHLVLILCIVSIYTSAIHSVNWVTIVRRLQSPHHT